MKKRRRTVAPRKVRRKGQTWRNNYRRSNNAHRARGRQMQHYRNHNRGGFLPSVKIALIQYHSFVRNNAQGTKGRQSQHYMNHNRGGFFPSPSKLMRILKLLGEEREIVLQALIDKLLPVVYTPTVGEACQKYGSIFRRPQGLYISLKEKGKILEVLKNWPQRRIQVIVVTDGERILGLGDLGCQCLPITIDVGTDSEKLLNDEFYIGLKQKRANRQGLLLSFILLSTRLEYTEFLHEFMCAVKQNYGEKVLVQFEGFANHHAFELFSKYYSSHLVLNDDIQGTASMVLAGLIAAQKVLGKSLADHTFLFLGAGEAGTGIAELIALKISKETGTPIDETRKKIWLVDSKVLLTTSLLTTGLIVSSHKESLQHFKQPWAHDHEPVNELLRAANAIKPTVLIGTSGVGKTFTKEVVEAMATFNETPLILALSNPTSQAECTAKQAYTWTQGRAIFASGSPFDPVEYEGKTFFPGQVRFVVYTEALASQVTEENFADRLIYPPFTNIRKISANIAASDWQSNLPRPKDLVKMAESCMYSPVY
ncbi:hypothetical protein YC2023_050262 [Brassica napus]